MAKQAPLVQRHGRFPYRLHVLIIGDQIWQVDLRIATGQRGVRWRILVPFQLQEPIPVGDLREARKIVDDDFKEVLASFLLDWEQRFLVEPSTIAGLPAEDFFPPNGLIEGQTQWAYRLELDRGVAEMGAQRPTNVEYFLTGGDWYRGRVVLSLMQREDVPEQLTPADVRTLGEVQDFWWFQTTARQTPLIMKRELDEQFELKEGFSALPSYIRERLPEGMNYWSGDGSVAQARDWMKEHLTFPRRRTIFTLTDPKPQVRGS